MHSLRLSECLCHSLIPALYVELGYLPMQNITHLHRQASYQSVSTPTHPHSLWGCQVNQPTHYPPPDLKITKLLSLIEGRICLVTVYKQLVCLTYQDDYTGLNSLAPRWQTSRLISCPSLVIAHCATPGRPLLPGTSPVRDGRGFVFG